jgi:hypothetical protein
MKIVLVFKVPSTHAEQPPVTLDGNTFTISKRTFRYFPDDIAEITLDLIFYGSTEPTDDEEWNDDLSDRIAYLRSIREANAKKKENQS